MKNSWLICISTAVLLSSCSLLQRNTEDLEAEANKPPFDPSETAETLETLAGSPGSYESEISRLNTKLSAMETKLDVLAANLEKVQLQKSQPIIEAQSLPQTSLAAPVEEISESQKVSALSAAPVRPNPSFPENTKQRSSQIESAVEKDFRSAMELFQSGRNLEAASRFAMLAKKYPSHLLASHSLYWAGEASARSKQWSLALQNWEELEKLYPRSAYVPEALAGLARAHESQGDLTKANKYSQALMQAFSRSPVAMAPPASRITNPQTEETTPVKDSQEYPSFEETAEKEEE